jgi:hypothetical protein
MPNKAGANPGGISGKISSADSSLGSSRDRKFRVALGLYGVLAAAIWFTLGEGSVLVLGRQVELRLIPLFVVGTFVFRTVMAREAEKIRRRGQDDA